MFVHLSSSSMPQEGFSQTPVENSFGMGVGWETIIFADHHLCGLQTGLSIQVYAERECGSGFTLVKSLTCGSLKFSPKMQPPNNLVVRTGGGGLGGDRFCGKQPHWVT